jgi:hypothetical protein
MTNKITEVAVENNPYTNHDNKNTKKGKRKNNKPGLLGFYYTKSNQLSLNFKMDQEDDK